MPDTPPAKPARATFDAAFRIALGVIGPLGIQRGWWDVVSWGDYAAALTSLGAIGYGLWKTHDRQARLTNAANGRIQP